MAQIPASSSTKHLAKDLKPRVEKAEKAAAELQIGDVYIKDKLKMARETLDRMEKSKPMWSDLLRCFTKMLDGMAAMTEASGSANHMLLQLSTLYRGDLGDTLRDITKYRNDVVQQFSKLSESLYTDFLVPVAKSLDPTMKEISEKKVQIKQKEKEVKKRMRAVEKNIFKVEKKSMSQVQLQEAMRKYNEVKDVLDVERAQVLQGVLVFERDRFKFLIDSYSNVVKSEIILGETMSAQWAGLRDWGAALSMGLGGEQAEALVTSREQSYKPLKKDSVPEKRDSAAISSDPVTTTRPSAPAPTPKIEAPPTPSFTSSNPNPKASPRLSKNETDSGAHKALSPRDVTPPKHGTSSRKKLTPPSSPRVDDPPAPVPAKVVAAATSPREDFPPPKTASSQRIMAIGTEQKTTKPLVKLGAAPTPKTLGLPAQDNFGYPAGTPKPAPNLSPATDSYGYPAGTGSMKKSDETGLGSRTKVQKEDTKTSEFSMSTYAAGNFDLTGVQVPDFMAGDGSSTTSSSSSQSQEDWSFSSTESEEPPPTPKGKPEPAQVIPERKNLQLKPIDSGMLKSGAAVPKGQSVKKTGVRASISGINPVDYSEGGLLFQQVDADMRYAGGLLERELKELHTLRGQEYVNQVHLILDGDNMKKAFSLVEEYEDFCDHFPEIFMLQENLQKKERFKQSLLDIKRRATD